MNKQKIKGIIKFSIKQNIQNKWFILFNIVLLIFAVIMTNANNIRKFLEDNNIKLFNDDITIEYVDNDNLLGNKLEEYFKDYKKITVKEIEKNEYDKDNIEDNLIVLEAFKDKEEVVKAKMTSKEGVDTALYDEIVKVLQEVRVDEFAKTNNLQKDKLELLNSEVTVERIMLGVDAENSDQKQAILFVSTVVVYMISIFIFSKIANEIANEKVSKSIEYVLTSVTAKEYLFAKIASIASVVLIQAIFVLAYYMMGNMLNSLIMIFNGASIVKDTTSVATVIDKGMVAYICVIFVYSILTLVLLSIIQAALSSKTTSMSEAGNSMTFLMIITIAVYTLTFALITPYTNMTTAIYIFSCIPLISNYFIPAIMIIGQAKAWQIIVSLALLIISIPITFNICSKIFKNGVLDYNNKKSNKKKAKKELTLKEEQNLKLEKSKFRTLALAIGFSIILYFAGQIIVQVVLGTLGASVLGEFFTESQASLVLMGLTSIISLVVPYGFLCLYINKRPTETKKCGKGNFLIAVFFTVLIQALLIVVEIILGIENTASKEILDIDGLDNLLTQILFVTAIGVIPGIFEELLFRKGLIDLTKGYGEKFAIFISALMFGVCHLNITQGIFAFFMGLILGTLYVKTGKMRYNMILHALNNSYAAITSILAFLELDFEVLVITAIALFFAVIGGMILISKILNSIKKKEKLIKLEGKVFPDNVKYMFLDYTFIVGTILLVLGFIVTEQMLKLL